MAPVLKSLFTLASLTFAAVFQLASASPIIDPTLMGGLDPGFAGGALGAGLGGGFLPGQTSVPVGPITIAAQTDFVPINNVWPVVNVLPTDFNDFSWFGPFGGSGFGGPGFGGIGAGIGGPGFGGIGGGIGGLGPF
ncbi:hypothetical protein BGZ94_002600 [Podila epigama]|nr:hypothetical protein BGZ94_002600 [Podila epigama]